ncbi:Serine/threonine-protein phosphatase 2A regulatory subunit B'' subunit alpha [Mycoemilia scoparia]|uniref:Serine/threonine-protein phosphatase 2A regulatory subunit B'' subunit alpha n=1 Tax=Mycoemilia scoparia TaxID=417184 RepID=A0A9W7ZYI3_9FUNG|nr:Serine/threonine-protein phosphatase 2A regulatory subunit B'' subunit alpha [Mycoemilia scoparia]
MQLNIKNANSASPERLPPLSPVVSTLKSKKKKKLDLTQDTPFPFSPTKKQLKTGYSPRSPTSPTATPRDRTEPESPTLSKSLVQDSPTLTLDERLTSGVKDEESPSTLASRSLLYKLELQSPLSKKSSGVNQISDMAANNMNNTGSGGSATPTSTLYETRRKSRLSMLSDTWSMEEEDEEGDGDSDEKFYTPRPGSKSSRMNTTSSSSTISNAGEIKPYKESPRLKDIKSPYIIPQFHISPNNPRVDKEIEDSLAEQLQKIRVMFEDDFGYNERDFAIVTEACGLPRYLNRVLFSRANEFDQATTKRSSPESWPTFEKFSKFWTWVRRISTDIHSLAFNIMTMPEKSKRSLTRADFHPVVLEVVDCHPELEFLEGQEIFAQHYVEAVTERIFYDANVHYGGNMTLAQFRNADVIGILKGIEVGIDVDVEFPPLFSYKHFYVLYCSFSELDSDHDSLVEGKDLLRYFNGALSRRIIARIMIGKGKPSEYISKGGKNSRVKRNRPSKRANSRYDRSTRLSDCRMTFRDFIWFLIAEIDKTTHTSLEYWFRCLDLDEDGVLTVYELEYFYEEQIHRMNEEMLGDVIPFNDLMCQLFDAVRPKRQGLITIKDLKAMPKSLLPIFFDAFMNLSRFCDHDSRSSLLQRQLALVSAQVPPNTSFNELISIRINFLDSMPPAWIEFAETEYEALLIDQQEQANLQQQQEEQEQEVQQEENPGDIIDGDRNNSESSDTLVATEDSVIGNDENMALSPSAGTTEPGEGDDLVERKSARKRRNSNGNDKRTTTAPATSNSRQISADGALQ